MTQDEQQTTQDEHEPEFPTKIADALESAAGKARSLTVDKAETVGKWVAAGPLLAMIGLLAVIFLLIGLTRLLGAVVGMEIAYAIIGGLLVLGALLIWRKRDPEESPDV
jgi:hypothetical protein